MSRLALTNARIFDGTGRAPLPAGTILVDGAMIAAVGLATDVLIPEPCRVLDLAGHTVLPCLLDGHMHISSEPGRLDHLGHVKAGILGMARLQRCLQWGTATVAHAAGSAESVVLRDLIQNGAIPDCADLSVGAVVTATGGHVRGQGADGPWEVRKAVRAMVMAGADHIKTCASGGFQWEHEQLSYEDYTPAELEALVAEAHARGKRVHVHAHAQPGLRHAITAGCDVILHGAHIDEAALEGIAAKGLWYMPTLHITSEEIWTQANRPEFMRERMKRAYPIHRAGVAKAREMGLKMAAGTDGGPGSVMHELVELVDCGFSPAEALVIGTRNTAEALGVLGRSGTLEPGKDASLIAVRGDPTETISILMDQDNIALILKKGTSIKGVE